MATVFPFKEEKSPLFGKIRRPIAEVYFKHKTKDVWQPVTMLIDTGADYTLFPKFLALPLGVTLSRDCKIISTQGVGGKSRVFLLKRKTSIRVGKFERQVPVGFLDNDYIPPLLGRQEFFETFKVVFERFTTRFE